MGSLLLKLYVHFTSLPCKPSCSRNSHVVRRLVLSLNTQGTYLTHDYFGHKTRHNRSRSSLDSRPFVSGISSSSVLRLSFVPFPPPLCSTFRSIEVLPLSLVHNLYRLFGLLVQKPLTTCLQSDLRNSLDKVTPSSLSRDIVQLLCTFV